MAQPSRRTQTKPTTARAAAAGAVEHVLADHGYVQRWLALHADALPGAERALAQQVSLGAVRTLLTIEHVLGVVGRYQPARTPPALRAVLVTGAYQLIYLDRIPAYAAVDESVSLARLRAGRGGAGMVNALLRRLCDVLAGTSEAWSPESRRAVRTGWNSARLLTRDVLPPRPMDQSDIAGLARHLGAAAGEHVRRVAALIERLGPDAAERMLWASVGTPPLVIQHFQHGSDWPGFRERVLASCAEPPEFADGAAFVPAGGVRNLGAILEGPLAFIQDVTARAAARLLGARPGERVLDLCAAPGGKTAALASEMADSGEIVACDVSAERLQQVGETAARLGLRCVRCELISTAPSELPDGGNFDAAIVDAPCSNSGVLARRPEARLRLGQGPPKALIADQQRLLALSAKSVRPGGRVVYSTCSIEPEENQQVVARFVAEHGWVVQAEQLTLPTWGPSPAAWRDGGYAALLQRVP